MRISKFWATALSFVLAFAGIAAISAPASAVTLDMTGQSVSFTHTSVTTPGSGTPTAIDNTMANDFTAARYYQVSVARGATSATSGANGSIVRYNSVATVSGSVVDAVVTTDFNIASKTITNISASGGVVTFTTATAHGFVPNQKVTTAGNSPTAYNLTSVTIASVPSATTFTVTNAASGSFVSGGTAVTSASPTVGNWDAASGTSPNFDVDVTAGVPYGGVIFRFAFYEHGTYTGVNTGTPVVLKNVTVNVADLDSGSSNASDEQFAEFSGFQSYLLNKRASGACTGGDTSIAYNVSTNPRCDDAKINVNPVAGTNLTRFVSTDAVQSNNIIQDVAAVKYDSFSSIDVKLGNISSGNLGKFIIAFSAPTWGTYGAQTYANANNTPPQITGTVPTLSVGSNVATVIRKSDFGTYYDFDNNPFYQLKVTSLPASGTLQYFTGGAWTSVTLNQVITVADIDLGKLRFTGSTDTSFTFKVNDSLDYSVSAYTMNITPVANTQTITFTNPGTKTSGAGTFASNATASSTLTVTLTSNTTGTCTVSGLNIVVVSPGPCTIVATQAGNANYAAATPVSQTFNISDKTAQTITFVDPGEQVRNGSDVVLVWASPKTSSTSGLTVTLTSLTTDVCTVSVTSITLKALGTCDVRATQEGDATYAPASPVERIFQVVGPSYTLTFAKDNNVGSVTTTGTVPSAVTSSTSWQLAGNTGSPVLAKSGYSFSGWTANSDGTGTTYAVGDYISLNADLTLYARWTVSSYTITYQTTNKTSGSAPSPTTGSGSISLATNSNSLARSHYYLSGWTIGGQHYDLGGSYTVTGNVNAEPEWSQYTITYLSTNKTGGSTPTDITDAGSVTIDGAGTLVRSHYYFAGWSINGTTYHDGDAYTLSSNVNASPVWAQYTITYLGTNKTGGSTPTNITDVGSVSIDGAGTLVRAHYYFVGWLIGSTTYLNGDVYNLSGDVNASPVWAQYTITYADAQGDGGALPSDTHGAGNTTLDANSGHLSRSGGWSLAGWTINTVDYALGDTFDLQADATATAIWTLGGFTLHYLDTDATSGAAPSDGISTNNIALDGPATLVRTHYHFAGWLIGGTTYHEGDNYPITGNIDATPVWEQFTLTYSAPSKDRGSVPTDLVGAGSETLGGNFGSLERDGWYLAGWTIGGVDYILGDGYTLSADATATARWAKYTITYTDTSSSSGTAPNATTGAGIVDLAYNTGSLSRTGYYLAGWTITGVGYPIHGSYTLNGDVTASPRWAQYSITFLGSSNTAGSTPSNTTYAGSFTLPGNTNSLVRNGYAFGGWVIDGANYATGDSFNVTKNVNVFARWLRCGITYTAANKSSGSVPGSLSGCVTITIAKNSGNLTRNGWYFNGWSIGGVSYQPGDTLTLNTAVTASAVWARYTITYLDADATSGSVPSPTDGFANTTLATNSGNLQRDNFYFAGWVLGNVEYSTGGTYNLRGNIFAFAKWKQYKITYSAVDADSGSIAADAISLGYLNIPMASYGSLARNGYLFAGWKIGATTYMPRETYSLTTNVTAVAQWVRCIITYNDGYSDSGNVPDPTTGCSNTLPSRGTISRSNFYFSGWVVEGVLYQPGATVTVTGHRTAYAQWKRYQLSFLGTNASSGNVPDNVYGYGTIATPRNTGTLVRSNYYLSGWRINGVDYAFGSTVSLTADLVASPIWSQYSINYSSTTSYNGNMPTRTYGYGSTATALNSGPISRPGYRFDGWVIGGVTYSTGTNYNLVGNVTAYAKWTKTS